MWKFLARLESGPAVSRLAGSARRPTATIRFSSRCSTCTTCCSRPCCSGRGFWLVLAIGGRRHRVAGAGDAGGRIRRRRDRVGDRLRHDFLRGRGRGRFPLCLLVRAGDACRRRRGAAGALRRRRVNAPSAAAGTPAAGSPAAARARARDFGDHAVDDPAPSSAEAAVRARRSRRGRRAADRRSATARWSRDRTPAPRWPCASVGRLLRPPDLVAAHQCGASASITEVSLAPP